MFVLQFEYVSESVFFNECTLQLYAFFTKSNYREDIGKLFKIYISIKDIPEKLSLKLKYEFKFLSEYHTLLKRSHFKG